MRVFATGLALTVVMITITTASGRNDADVAAAAEAPCEQSTTACLIELLSGVVYVPTSAEMLAVHADPTLDLIALAQGDLQQTAGVRLRAYRALSEFGEQPGVIATLKAAITTHSTTSTAMDSLYLRAAITSLATTAGPECLEPIKGQLLAHPDRDVVVTAARALAVCIDATATPSQINEATDALMARQQGEELAQITEAISTALRDLDKLPQQ